MSRKFHPCQKYEPPRCWVGDAHKIAYATREEAEMAAKVAEYDHKTGPLSVYKCEYGDHYHLTRLNFLSRKKV